MKNRCVFGCEGSDGLGGEGEVVSYYFILRLRLERHNPKLRHECATEDIPQRLHSVCVLLWRFPKEEVPFAVVAHQ